MLGRKEGRERGRPTASALKRRKVNESLPASCERGGDPKWRLEKRKEEKL